MSDRRQSVLWLDSSHCPLVRCCPEGGSRHWHVSCSRVLFEPPSQPAVGSCARAEQARHKKDQRCRWRMMFANSLAAKLWSTFFICIAAPPVELLRRRAGRRGNRRVECDLVGSDDASKPQYPEGWRIDHRVCAWNGVSRGSWPAPCPSGAPTRPTPVHGESSKPTG
jgi:hypothetical protein